MSKILFKRLKALLLLPFPGTYIAGAFSNKYLYLLLGGLPPALDVATLGLLSVQNSIRIVGIILIVWVYEPAGNSCHLGRLGFQKVPARASLKIAVIHTIKWARR